MLHLKLSLLVLSVFFCSKVISYKILVVNPIPARSHYNLGKAIADILHEHKHEITLVTAYKSEKPMYREVYIKEMSELNDNSMVSFNSSTESKMVLMYKITTLIGPMTKVLLRNTDMQKLMAGEYGKFDLVIVEHFLNDLYVGFAVKFDAPLIFLSPVSMMSWLATFTGNPTSPATVPNIFSMFPSNMNLWQRTVNTGMTILQEFIGWWLMNPYQKATYEELFPEEAKKLPFEKLGSKVSLILSNTHPTIGVARPLLPNVVEIGGYHIGKTAPLPQDLQDILDSAKHGVIYFSMGSNLNSSKMSEENKLNILMAFSELKETVLWKFEENLPGKPRNVFIRKWMPQDSILAHPNVKLFISHGGLLSCTEAVHHGVPLLVMPIFGDQNHNALAVVERGHGIILEYTNITQTSLRWSLNEVLNNPRYTKNAKRLHKIYHDRPLSPRNMVNFYAEHVIRTGGAPHLSPPRISRISELLLDVFVLISVPPFLLFITVVIACRKCFKGKAAAINKKKDVKVPAEKKKNK